MEELIEHVTSLPLTETLADLDKSIYEAYHALHNINDSDQYIARFVLKAKIDIIFMSVNVIVQSNIDVSILAGERFARPIAGLYALLTVLNKDIKEEEFLAHVIVKREIE